MKLLLSLLCTVIAIHWVQGQPIFRKGYIVTNTNDTLVGEIGCNSWTETPVEFVLQGTSLRAARNCTAGDTWEVVMETGDHYIANTLGGYDYFVQLIARGAKLCLYKRLVGGETLYYITQFKKDILLPLKEVEDVSLLNDVAVIPPFRRQLLRAIEDDTQVSQRIRRIALSLDFKEDQLRWFVNMVNSDSDEADDQVERDNLTQWNIYGRVGIANHHLRMYGDGAYIGRFDFDLAHAGLFEIGVSYHNPHYWEHWTGYIGFQFVSSTVNGVSRPDSFYGNDHNTLSYKLQTFGLMAGGQYRLFRFGHSGAECRIGVSGEFYQSHYSQFRSSVFASADRLMQSSIAVDLKASWWLPVQRIELTGFYRFPNYVDGSYGSWYVNQTFAGLLAAYHFPNFRR